MLTWGTTNLNTLYAAVWTEPEFYTVRQMFRFKCMLLRGTANMNTLYTAVRTEPVSNLVFYAQSTSEVISGREQRQNFTQ